MPRPLRVEFPYALYHVTARGTQKAPIVLDDFDRMRWMEYLKEAVLRFGLELYAFVLMNNHYHLFVCAVHANLGKAMQYLNGAYAMYFNVRHGRGGHLFERRYRGILVENRGHYTEISRYVHLNPVRAGLVERPEGYSWSSYPGYHSGRMTLSWVNYWQVLDEFGKGKDARTRYRKFVADAIGKKLKPPWAAAVGGWLLGGTKFTSKVYAMLAANRHDGRWNSRATVPVKTINVTLDDIARAVSKVYGINAEVLRSAGPDRGEPRSAFILIARDRAGVRLQVIGGYAGIASTGSVSQAVQRARRCAASDRGFSKAVRRVEALLK